MGVNTIPATNDAPATAEAFFCSLTINAANASQQDVDQILQEVRKATYEMSAKLRDLSRHNAQEQQANSITIEIDAVCMQKAANATTCQNEQTQAWVQGSLGVGGAILGGSGAVSGYRGSMHFTFETAKFGSDCVSGTTQGFLTAHQCDSKLDAQNNQVTGQYLQSYAGQLLKIKEEFFSNAERTMSDCKESTTSIIQVVMTARIYKS